MIPLASPLKIFWISSKHCWEDIKRNLWWNFTSERASSINIYPHTTLSFYKVIYLVEHYSKLKSIFSINFVKLKTKSFVSIEQVWALTSCISEVQFGTPKHVKESQSLALQSNTKDQKYVDETPANPLIPDVNAVRPWTLVQLESQKRDTDSETRNRRRTIVHEVAKVPGWSEGVLRQRSLYRYRIWSAPLVPSVFKWSTLKKSAFHFTGLTKVKHLVEQSCFPFYWVFFSIKNESSMSIAWTLSIALRHCLRLIVISSGLSKRSLVNGKKYEKCSTEFLCESQAQLPLFCILPWRRD